MASPTSAPPEKQPKVVQKLLVRTFAFLVIVAGLVFGIQWYRTNKSDLAGGQVASTDGWIVAVEYKNDGQEAVAIKPDQSIVRAGGWKDGAMDRNALWALNGNFAFFISDRGGEGFQIYRWNPEAATAEVRSVGPQGRSNPTFRLNQDAKDQSMLMTSGGNIIEFDPSEKRQVLVLPPSTREISVGLEGDDSGAQSQFAATYGRLGTAFRYARWCGPDNNFIIAIMKRDEGDLLLVQDMTPKDDVFPPPAVITAGDRIELDVNPKTGDVVYTVLGFQWPAAPPRDPKTNKVVAKPFRNYVGIWSPKPPTELPVIVQAKDDAIAFESPAIHPSGESVVVAVGPVKDGAVERDRLVTLPTKPNAGAAGSVLIPGAIYEPSWSPTGDRLVYAKRQGSDRHIFVANADGSSERAVTSGSTRYGYPQFSPQTK